MSAVSAAALAPSLAVSYHVVASSHTHQQCASQTQHTPGNPLPTSHCHMKVVQTDHKWPESSTHTQTIMQHFQDSHLHVLGVSHPHSIMLHEAAVTFLHVS